MSNGSWGCTVVLEGGAKAPTLGGSVVVSASRAEAEGLLRASPAGVVVADPAVGWHAELACSAREKGCAVLAVGAEPPPAGLADEWLAPGCAEAEAAARLGLAVARARERRRLLRRSAVDALTGLPNRRAMLAEALRLRARARRTGEALALVLIDLDDFKEVNDRLGHPEGDRLLRRVAEVLAANVRQGERCGRLGGDEFALVVSGTLADAERARDRLAAALDAAGISATTGLASAPPAAGLRALYAEADHALRAAKQRRRRFTLFPRKKEVESTNTLSLS